jgi:hypothetical protein
MLTEGAVEKPCTAVIVAVGPGKKEKPEDEEVKPVGVAVGDRVMYFKYAGDKAGFVCVQVGIQFLFLRWLFRPPARPLSVVLRCTPRHGGCTFSINPYYSDRQPDGIVDTQKQSNFNLF